MEQIVPKIELKYFAGYIGYPVLGYYIMNKKWTNVRRIRWISVLMIVASSTTMVVVTHIMSQAKDRFWGGVVGNMSPLVVLMAVGVFLLFRHLSFEGVNPTFRAVIRFLSKYSYGVYLVHAMVFLVLWHFGIYHSFINPAFGIPVTAILCFALSILTVWAVNKLPYIGKYISG
jgi:peptidoglycan/LPS O-acetylase OafA/YrhL